MRGILCGLIFSAVLIFAQTTPAPTSTIAGAGYTAPAPLSAAPGQILTVFVDGLGLSLPQPVQAPAGAALPVSLAGVAATLLQNGAVPVPVIQVQSISTCPSGGSQSGSTVVCSSLAAVTVQIPYELVPLCPLCARPVAFPPQWLYVSYNGKAGTAIELNPLADQVHILRSCDLVLQSGNSPVQTNTTGLPCPPMVTHMDGTLVSPSSPANIGEPLVAWATGLGQTNPASATGQPAPASAPTSEAFSIDFEFKPNALPAKPFPTGFVGGPRLQAPAYTGLVKGFVGLYQINFVVPAQTGQGTPRCALSGTFAAGSNVVQSNLTVSIGGSFSFDGAGICVATLIPVD